MYHSESYPIWTYQSSTFDVSQVHHHIHVWRPLLKFLLPGCDGGERYNKQKGSIDIVVMEQSTEETDGLDGFSQSHLIGKNTAVFPTPGTTQPVKSSELVVTQLQGIINIIAEVSGHLLELDESMLSLKNQITW